MESYKHTMHYTRRVLKPAQKLIENGSRLERYSLSLYSRRGYSASNQTFTSGTHRLMVTLALIGGCGVSNERVCLDSMKRVIQQSIARMGTDRKLGKHPELRRD